MAKTQTGLRLDQDLLTRLERLAVEMSKRAGGIAVVRAEVARAALERGIAVLEIELLGKAQRSASKPRS
jgi:predicted transcriptional regulator